MPPKPLKHAPLLRGNYPPPAHASIPLAAKRALAEATARRAQRQKSPPMPREYGGRNGLDPVRYGDWEKRGLAVDF